MKLNRLLILLGLLNLLIVSCEDPNNWGYDPNYDNMYRPIHFDIVEERPTSVIVSFTGVIDATKYVFEFSEGDSLLFNNIVRTETALVDTLTAYKEESTVTATEYRLLFEDLHGTSRYSIRVKGVDDLTGKESGWTALCFDTPAEQIFTKVVPGITSATLQWDIEKEATNIKYGQLIQNDEPELDTDTLWIEDHQLTDTELQNGQLVISDLQIGTNYIAQILNDGILRGTYTFRTLGSSTSTLINVTPQDDINIVLANVAGTVEAPVDVTLAFEGGLVYKADEIIIPEGIKNIYLSGNIVNGINPVLEMSKFTFSAPMGNFYVQYMDVLSNGGSQFLIEIGNGNCFTNISFTGCTVREVPRSIIRMNSNDAMAESINIDNCILKNIGLSGYGLLNIGKAGTLNSISITDCTLWEIGDQIIDLRVALSEFEFSNCTFYNNETGIPKMFRLDKQPKMITITNCIFSGPNGGSKVNSGNSDYSGWLSYAGCYVTSDMVIDSREFNDAISLEYTSDDLFIDPTNGDFCFKPELKFDGEGVAGDPRWWAN